MRQKKLIQVVIGLILVMLFLAACGATEPTTTQGSPTAIPLPPATSIPPSETPAPVLSKPPTFDVPYVSDGNRLQRLDVFLPEGEDGPFPTIIAIYGGGFEALGSKAAYYDLANHFNKMGYALVTINYRVAPEFHYPAPVQDAFCALAWMHANAATYGFDTERIIALGDSSGGYLAAMLGSVDTPSIYMEDCPNLLPQTDWILGVVVFYTQYDYTSIDGLSDDLLIALEALLGTTFGAVPAETLAEMSPMSWVDGSEPPFLIINGTNDVTTPSWMAEDFASALEDSGATVELLIVDAGHAFIKATFLPAYKQALEAVEAFLAALFEE